MIGARAGCRAGVGRAFGEFDDARRDDTSDFCVAIEAGCAGDVEWRVAEAVTPDMAASVSGLLMISIDAMIAEKPKQEKAAALPAGGGMSF